MVRVAPVDYQWLYEETLCPYDPGLEGRTHVD